MSRALFVLLALCAVPAAALAQASGNVGYSQSGGNSRAEQMERLRKRLSSPEKNWKFNPGDLAERRKWKEYTTAYRDAILRCSTREAPWYVVPADNKKVRNFLIARTIADTLSSLKLRWPKADADVIAKGLESD